MHCRGNARGSTINHLERGVVWVSLSVFFFFFLGGGSLTIIVIFCVCGVLLSTMTPIDERRDFFSYGILLLYNFNHCLSFFFFFTIDVLIIISGN